MKSPIHCVREFNFGLMICLGCLAGANIARSQPGSEVWNFSTTGPILSSPAIGSDGTIYIGSYDRKLHAVTSAGASKWSFTLPSSGFTGIYSSPAIGSDGTIYFGGEDGTLYALKASDGSSKWTFDTGTAIYSSPAVASDGTVYFGSYNVQNNDTPYLYAVTNGVQRWRYQPADNIFSSPVLGLDGAIYFGCDDGNLYALNTNGTLRWKFKTGTKAITASPSIGIDGKIYVGVGSSTNPKMYSANTNGTTNWIFTATNRIRSAAALAADGTVYFGSDDNYLYALNTNGTLKWSVRTGNTNGSSPALAADGTIYMGSDDHKLYAFNSSGSTLWTFETGDLVFPSPAIGADGTVYVGSSDGSLYAVSGSSGLAGTPWPMFRHDIKHTGQLVDTAPVVPDVSTATDLNTPVSISTNKLLLNATDAEGQPLAVTGASSTSTNGGMVAFSGGVLTYTPVANYSGADRIDFMVADAHNVTTGHVLVTVRPANTQGLNIQSIVNNGGSSVTITFAGIPNRYYIVESTTNLSAPVPPNWIKIRTNQAAADGIWSYTDPVSPGSRFYRSTGGTVSAP